MTKKASGTTTPSASKPNDAGVSATQIVVKKPKPTPQEFEAEQVERLKGLFQGGAAVPRRPRPHERRRPGREEGIPTRSAPTIRRPSMFPTAVVAVRDQLRRASRPEALAPYVREGVEQAYRGSQMIPWVNVVVPITKIVPLIGPATGQGRDRLWPPARSSSTNSSRPRRRFIPLLRLRPGRRPRQPGRSGRRAERAGVRRRLGSARLRQSAAQRRRIGHRLRPWLTPTAERRRRVGLAARPSSARRAREASSPPSSRGTAAWAR